VHWQCSCFLKAQPEQDFTWEMVTEMTPKVAVSFKLQGAEVMLTPSLHQAHVSVIKEAWAVFLIRFL